MELHILIRDGDLFRPLLVDLRRHIDARPHAAIHLHDQGNHLIGRQSSGSHSGQR